MGSEERQPFQFDWRTITPGDSPKTPPDLLADPAVRDLATPNLREGDLAHNFRLDVFDFSTGEERATGEKFDLLERARERPVALIFGSYT